VNNGVDMERLQRQVSSDSDAYQAYVRKTEEARASEALTQQDSERQRGTAADRTAAAGVSEYPVQYGRWLVTGGAVRSGGRVLAEESDSKIYSSGVVNISLDCRSSQC